MTRAIIFQKPPIALVSQRYNIHLLVLICLAACTNDKAPVIQQEKVAFSNIIKSSHGYELVLIEESIYVERFDSTIVDSERYNRNNSVYTVGSSFRYAYEYLDQKGEAYYFKTSSNNDWNFVPLSGADQTTVKEVIIGVTPGAINSDYNQTLVSYTYPPNLELSGSGVIENEMNVWLHPPRDYLFRILELTPFPFVQQPYEVGNKWQWKLSIGSHWADKRWKEWDGRITNNYTYQITDVKEISTAIGRLECYVVEAVAESELGKTSLTAFYNKKHGFVKLAYTNIDGSKLNMRLIERRN